jgi:hypothetical protein
MAIPDNSIYPRRDHETVYLKNVVTDPRIFVGDFTFYNDFVRDSAQFQTNNVLYHYPINEERLIMASTAPSPAGQSSSLPAQTMRCARFPPIHSRSSQTIGGWDWRTSPLLGTTRATSWLAMTYGSATKR